MFCTKCAKENNDDANFCAYCGMAIGKEQARTSSRGVATKCCICGKELSPSEVRFVSSTSFKPCCLGCLGKTASGTDTPRADVETDIKAWTKARCDRQLEKILRLQEAEQACLEAKKAGPPFDLERIYRAVGQYLLATRVVRDGYTGEATASIPIPEVRTEAGMAEAVEIEEFNLFQVKQNEMLDRIIAEKTQGRGVAIKCCICGKELSSSEVRLAPSTSPKPFCASCLGKTVTQTDAPKPYEELPTDVGSRARDAQRAVDAMHAFVSATRAGPAFNKEQAVKLGEEALLAMRKVIYEIPGRATKAKPMPDLTTEAGLEQAVWEINDFGPILIAEQKRLEEIRRRQL